MIANKQFSTSRASRLDSILQKKKRIPTFEKREELKKRSIGFDIARIPDTEFKGDGAQSIQRSAPSGESEETIEIQPDIFIPRPTEELSLEQLIAIAEKFQDPNKPYVVSMVFCKDGRVIKNYSDGTRIEKKPVTPVFSQNAFEKETQALINWYHNEQNLPTAPFTRTTGFVSPKGKYNTNIIKDHKAYYTMIDSWIALGPESKIVLTGLLKKELECLKNIVKQNKEG